MVVAPLTLTCIALATLFVALLPLVLYRRLRRPLGLSSRDAIAGIAVFALFAMVIERALNGYVLHQNPTTAAWLSDPIAFVIYGALIAGVCEEGGRFIAMKLMWRRLTTRSAALATANPAAHATATTLSTATASTGDGTALAYGLGHGGAEAWMVGVLVQIQWIVFAVIDNRGELDTYLGNVPPDALMRLHLILASLSPQSAGIFLLERVAALVFQIGMSVLMWRGVRAGWRTILPLAIVVHALVNVPATLFQARVLPLYAVDAIYALAAVIVAGVLMKLLRQPARTI